MNLHEFNPELPIHNEKAILCWLKAGHAAAVAVYVAREPLNDRNYSSVGKALYYDREA